VSTTEPKETKLEISLPQGGFPKVMYFNRFRVDRDPEFKLVQFGLIVDTDLVDGYSSILPNDALRQNEKSLLDYLNRIGRAAENADGSWKGLTGECHASVADIITMAHRGGVAETGLFIFSLSAATRLHKAGAANETILAQPLVLLRSSAELQKQLIQSLYAE
jgi:hypothetical protein